MPPRHNGASGMEAVPRTANASGRHCSALRHTCQRKPHQQHVCVRRGTGYRIKLGKHKT